SNKEIFPSKKVISVPEIVTFDTSKHLEFIPPSKLYTIEDLGFSGRKEVSPIGVSERFSLFSAEAVQQMRKEILNPETLEIVSSIAKVDLIPAMDFEIGYINFSMSSKEDKSRDLSAAEKQEREATGESQGGESPIVDWKTDSYPFVCVTMLSDCTDMIGGEIALVVKVREPQ
ncbi:hypothetical protein N7537_004778, partial [Penicillium hordei]